MDEDDQLTLHLDQLTASVALPDLLARGNDLGTLAQAIDEEWGRYAPPESVPPGHRAKHLISTMTNRQDSPPTGLTYTHTQLIQPGPIRAEDRDIKDRFLRGKPLLTAEIVPVDDGYLLQTAILRMGIHLTAVLDWARGHATFYVLQGDVPDTLMAAAPGRRLGDIVATGHCEDLVVEEMYTAGMDEMRGVLAQMWTPSVAIRTGLPQWTTLDFTPIYERRP